MKKVSVILLVLFFSGYAPPANCEDQFRIFAGLRSLLFNDPEVDAWLNRNKLFEAFPPSDHTRNQMLRIFSATKRGMETIGIGLLGLGIYVANTVPPEVSIFEDNFCSLNGSLP